MSTPDTGMILEWEDINYLAVVSFTGYFNGKPLNLAFEAYRIEGWDDDGPWYRIKDYAGTGSETRDRNLAGRFAEGTIKWDGCCDIMFQPDDPKHYEHWCSRDQASAWGIVVNRLYETLSKYQAE